MIVMNLGGIANDNVLNQNNLQCTVTENGGVPSS